MTVGFFDKEAHAAFETGVALSHAALTKKGRAAGVVRPGQFREVGRDIALTARREVVNNAPIA